MAETEPIVFLNGELVPESQAGIPIRDRGFIYGDAVFDAARTFNGVPFKLAEHVKRLYDSLRYVRIDPGIGWKHGRDGGLVAEGGPAQLPAATARTGYVGDAAHHPRR